MGLSIAIVLIGLIMGVLFKSFKMTILSLIPNVIPLIMIAGLIGFFNINLNISTSIIFTIAFGIAVDDTIHFLSKFKIELGKGKSVPYALKRTFLSTGKAIIITSFILMGGFLTLMYSSFNGTFYTGLFISLTLMFAVVADLLLIPSLFLLLYKNKKD
jgi:predicted RND superfamily exporter protein